jgi:hypothetical protein
MQIERKWRPAAPRGVVMIDYLSSERDYSTLSLIDLLTARDQFHIHLMHKANVIGTAVGKYRIRKDEPWPQPGTGKSSASSTSHRPKGERTLSNSEVRDYSWPAVLVFVREWIPEGHFASGTAQAADFIPPAIYMPNGDKVPICIIKADRDEQQPATDGNLVYPSNLIGGGYPILADVQQQEHVASVGCLVTDGHLTYALTNRHVAGAPGETLYSILNGNKVPIGTTSNLQLTRKPFSEVYADWPGTDTFVNLDIGLIEVDDINRWTTQVYGIGQIGDVADLSSTNITLRLIGCPVVAYGAASGLMKGEICSLFYRYREQGGSEYVADFLIGPRGSKPLGTRPGDSGTLWSIDPQETGQKPNPIALQWGGQVFIDGKTKSSSSYALATCLSTVSNLLNVEVVRDWNFGFPEYWGAVGHYSIANKACGVISDAKLSKLMNNNLERITYDIKDINKKEMAGLSKRDFVPLADVPDMVWKVGPHKRGGMTSPEHANHFADMDRELDPPQPGGSTLLAICGKTPSNVTVPVWQSYYDAVKKQYPAQEESRGLLPFRVQQFYEGMVEFLKAGDVESFVCAAGIVSHYIGDACQPLHISYLFNGDPDRPIPTEVTDKKTGITKTVDNPTGKGVHSAYEDDMVNYNVAAILPGVDQRLGKLAALPLVSGGHGAAVAVVQLMDRTFDAIKPMDIVNAYVSLEEDKPKDAAMALWKQFGGATMDVMADGCLCLAQIWESAWAEGDGSKNISDFGTITESKLETLYQDPDFMPSKTLNTISSVLTDKASLGAGAKKAHAKKAAPAGRNPAKKRGKP